MRINIDIDTTELCNRDYPILKAITDSLATGKVAVGVEQKHESLPDKVESLDQPMANTQPQVNTQPTLNDPEPTPPVQILAKRKTYIKNESTGEVLQFNKDEDISAYQEAPFKPSSRAAFVEYEASLSSGQGTEQPKQTMVDNPAPPTGVTSQQPNVNQQPPMEQPNVNQQQFNQQPPVQQQFNQQPPVQQPNMQQQQPQYNQQPNVNQQQFNQQPPAQQQFNQQSQAGGAVPIRQDFQSLVDEPIQITDLSNLAARIRDFLGDLGIDGSQQMKQLSKEDFNRILGLTTNVQSKFKLYELLNQEVLKQPLNYQFV